MNQYRVIMEVEPRYTEDPVVLDQVQVIAADGSRVPEELLIEDYRSAFAE